MHVVSSMTMMPAEPSMEPALATPSKLAGMSISFGSSTGTDEPPDPDWPPDDELLALAAGGEAARVAPVRFGPPVSPHFAAELAARPVDVPRSPRVVRAAAHCLGQLSRQLHAVQVDEQRWRELLQFAN